MKAGGVLRLAARTMRRNRVRTFLTMLGIIIGVASVIAMLAVGQGAKKAISDQIASLGTNVIMIFPGSFMQGGVSQGAGTQSRLTEGDATLIRAHCPAVSHASPLVRTTQQVKCVNKNWRTSIQGVYPEYLDIRDWPLSEGTAFSDNDERGAVKTCLIGQTVAENLFGDGSSVGEDPVGQTIRIKNLPFKVLGLLAEKGQNMMGQDQDDIIFAPFSTVQKKLIGSTWASQVVVSAVTADSIAVAVAQIKQLFQSPLGGSRDTSSLNIRTQTEIATASSQTANVMSVLLACVAAVSLVVGGIGIMNIMLVSVAERTREIGIRMAVGAKPADILLQFIVEASVISVIGGIIGVMVGGAASLTIAATQGWPVLVTPFSVLLGFLFSAAIGIFFGWYPARKAADLNPIDALRYE
ncbi:MAG TPA: ABC transporter permease [Candidatus Edwardsbacteria bacterium]|nr:ABC transporter permease [Candidatus Edwardsbacteria bacterium]